MYLHDGVKESMKFSVLLPTRDRIELLRHAVLSVREQDFDDWELIIADNASQADIASLLNLHEDPRIHHLRSDEALAVTDNWNNALAASSGDYVVMLGDDDALAPGYFTRLSSVIEMFSQPDLIYTGAWLFTFPGVRDDYPDGFIQDYSYAHFFRSASQPFLLSRSDARYGVANALRFRVTYGFNMQFVCVARRLVDQISESGTFFASPFPDYFAMNALMLEAMKPVAVPERLVVIGVSPKSYGFFHETRQENEGSEFLGNTELLNKPADLVPGSSLNDSWLLAMRELVARFGPKHGLRLSVARYRFVQFVSSLEGVRREGDVGDWKVARKKWSRLERAIFLLGAWLLFAARHPRSPLRRHRIGRYVAARLGQLPDWSPDPITGPYETQADIFAAMERHEFEVS